MPIPRDYIRVEHYYRPLVSLNKAISKISKKHSLFKELRTTYRENPRDPSSTTLCIPLLKKHRFKDNSKIFDRNFMPEGQAEATERATMRYSLYEIREAITVATAFINYFKRNTIIPED